MLQLVSGIIPAGAEPAEAPAHKPSKQEKGPAHDFPAQNRNKNAQKENITGTVYVRISARLFGDATASQVLFYLAPLPPE